MEDTFIHFLESILPANDSVIYLILFCVAIIENVFPPIPGDTVMAFGAFLVGTGRLNYFLVYFFTTVGSVIGFTALFLLGKKLGRNFFDKKNFRYFPRESILRAEKWFSRYGYLVVLSNRLFPGIRSVISISSGILKMSTLKVAFCALISASIWNLLWIQIGYSLGNNWELVRATMQNLFRNYNIIASIFLVLAVILYISYRIRKKKVSPN